MEFLDRLAKVHRGEVRPHPTREVELRVGALPQQKITESLLAARPDEKIHVARFANSVVDARQQSAELVAIEILDSARVRGDFPRSADYRIPCRVIDGNPQVQ